MLGAAIERAYRDSKVGTQEVLADILGVDQTTVSKWCRGTIPASVAWVSEVERVCGLPRGQVFVWAGLVEPAVSWGADVVRLPERRRAEAGARAAAEGTATRPKGRRTTRPTNDPEPEGP